MSETPINVVVGDGVCPICGHAGQVKANKKGRLYIYCATPADGGCGNSAMSRSVAADRHYAQKFVTRWRKPEYRQSYLGDASEPAPAASDPGRPAKGAPARARKQPKEPTHAEEPEEDETEDAPRPESAEERNARIDRELNG